MIEYFGAGSSGFPGRVRSGAFSLCVWLAGHIEERGGSQTWTSSMSSALAPTPASILWPSPVVPFVFVVAYLRRSGRCFFSSESSV